MDNLSKESKPYVSGEYNDIFNFSEVRTLSAEEAVRCSESYHKALEFQSAIRFAEKRAWREAFAEGFAESYAKARAEGIKEGKMAVARKMKLSGQPVEYIREICGLSPEIIASL